MYGYFQKSIYGIYFTFPTIRSGGWESDILYRVIETRKKPDPTTHRPPPVWDTHPPLSCSSCRLRQSDVQSDVSSENSLRPEEDMDVLSKITREERNRGT